MALTLPNPSMVFVPLDILTADELNQMVQNITTIANQFPLAAANIADKAIATAKLADSAVTNVKIANNTIESGKLSNGTGTASIAPTDKNVIRIGGRKIMWGKITLTGVPSGQEQSRDQAFPEAFSNVPIVMLTVGSWEASPMLELNGATTSKFSYVFKHMLGSNTNPTINWTAIG